MTCQRYQSLLLLYLENRLAAKEAHRLQEHLARCKHCQQRLSEMRSLWNKEIPVLQPAPDFLFAVRRRIVEAASKKVPRKRNRAFVVESVLKPVVLAVMLLVSLMAGKKLAERLDGVRTSPAISTPQSEELYALEMLQIHSEWSLVGVYLSLGEE